MKKTQLTIANQKWVIDLNSYGQVKFQIKIKCDLFSDFHIFEMGQGNNYLALTMISCVIYHSLRDRSYVGHVTRLVWSTSDSSTNSWSKVI